jgi:hypothetical protein
MGPRISANAHPRYIVVTDISAFALVTLLLLLVSRIPSILSPLALISFLAAFALGFAAHIGLWLLRGIRSVDLDDDALLLYRGASLTLHRVERRLLRGVRIRRGMGRRMALLRLASGKRLRIPEDAFPREAFARFLAALEEWGK